MIFIITISHDFGLSVSSKPLIPVTPVLLSAHTKCRVVYTLANYKAAMVHMVSKRPISTFLSTHCLDFEITLWHYENVVCHTIIIAISRIISRTLSSIPVCNSKRAKNSPSCTKMSLSFTCDRVHTPKFSSVSVTKSHILIWLVLIAQSRVGGVPVIHNYSLFRAWVILFNSCAGAKGMKTIHFCVDVPGCILQVYVVVEAEVPVVRIATKSFRSSLICWFALIRCTEDIREIFGSRGLYFSDEITQDDYCQQTAECCFFLEFARLHI